MKIAVAGAGYVGMSISLLLSKNNEVIVYDIVKEKIDLINNKKSTIKEEFMSEFFENNILNIRATQDFIDAFKDSDYIIICTPTDYNEEEDFFNTSLVEDIIEKSLLVNKNATLIIKSTIPVGFTEKVKEKYNYDKIIFVPEFLREGNALKDCLEPSRIIIGDSSKEAIKFSELLNESTTTKNSKIIFTNSKEAEAIKLFANTYLAMRVSFFNELDNYCIDNELNTSDIISGISSDLRIGEGYNNPSFGYGGYCLPKDTKQLVANFNKSSTKQSVIESIVISNKLRKEKIAEEIKKLNPKTVGIYKLSMKTNSDNSRMSAILDIAELLIKDDFNIIIYEPSINNNKYKIKNYNIKVENDFNNFVNNSEIILANRIDENLKNYNKKIYTRDIFNEN